jgi:hypothetical protein
MWHVWERRGFWGELDGKGQAKVKSSLSIPIKKYRGVHIWLNLALCRGAYLKERDYLEVLGVDGSIIIK